MTSLKKLLAENLNKPVTYEPLWKLTTWDKRFNNVDNLKQPKVHKYHYFLAGDLKPLVVKGGEVKILTTNLSDLWTTEELAGKFLSEGEFVAIPWGGNPVVHYHNGKFLTADNRIAMVNDSSVLLTKYLYYFLLENLETIKSFYKGAGIKHPTMSKVLDLQVPIPPVEIQAAITETLDNFVSIESELLAELNARTSQMEFYSRSMTEVFSDSEIERSPLSEISDIGTGSRNTQDAVLDGKYPFYVRSQTPLSSEQFEFDEEAVITAGDGVGVGKVFHFAEGKYSLHQRAYRVKPDSSKILPKYLYYYMKNNFGPYLETAAVHASVTSLRRPMFEKFEIVYPTNVVEQELIVNFLDKIESYLGDDTSGLHGEINARRKQYEYYRSLLFKFEVTTKS
jgi:type I restriction enzyme S subunit